jgi:hypothetical protein
MHEESDSNADAQELQHACTEHNLQIVIDRLVQLRNRGLSVVRQDMKSSAVSSHDMKWRHMLHTNDVPAVHEKHVQLETSIC